MNDNIAYRSAMRDAGRMGGPQARMPAEPEQAELSPRPVLISVQETARIMGIGKDTVYALCNSGQLPHIRLGKRILVSVDGLKAWIASNDGRDIFGGRR